MVIRDCPFCGAAEPWPGFIQLSTNKHQSWISCGKCLASGPRATGTSASGAYYLALALWENTPNIITTSPEQPPEKG